MSIAWAVSEYLHNEKTIQAKTLFATHYHELTELALLYPKIKNYNVTVEEWDNKIIFLRKIIPGGTDNSYGIHVAQMAGLPRSVIERAREILTNLEANELSPNRMPKLAKRNPGRDVDRSQVSLFPPAEKSKIEKELTSIDLNKMTPLEALIKLNELKEKFSSNWYIERKDKINKFILNGFLSNDKEIIKCTSKGYLICDEIISKLL